MKKTGVILGVVALLVALGLLVLAVPGGVSIGFLHMGNEDRAFLRDRTVDFLEDIKFKDFSRASTYHLPETQAARDIPSLIRKVFMVKHELLDIQKYRILGVEMDRKQTRARVRATVDYRVLGDKRIRDNLESVRDVEMLFYWFQQKDKSWVMELESSLRP